MDDQTKQALQDELDQIEEKLLSIAGYLALLRKTGAILPMFARECGDQEERAGEAMEALLAAKKRLGLHSDLKLA